MARHLLVIIAVLLATTGCSDTIKGKFVAEPQIEVFHQHLNATRFEDIYSKAGDDFRNAAPKEKVIELFTAIQKKLGPVKSSSTTGWNTRTNNFVTTVVIGRATVFERGTGNETFTFRVSGDKATLVGYNINSLDMLTK